MAYIVEVRRVKMTEIDPPLPVFTLEIKGEETVWPETFGSVEVLNAFLKGLQAGLRFEGYLAIDLVWNIAPQWRQPTGLRWILEKDTIPVRQELDSDGQVIRL